MRPARRAVAAFVFAPLAAVSAHSSNENQPPMYRNRVVFIAYFNAGVRALDIRDPLCANGCLTCSTSGRSLARLLLLATTNEYAGGKPPGEGTVTASLVITAIGPDRPGIVNRLSDVARQFGANWAGSRMASLAGQFAGMVHFQVAEADAARLAAALQALESSDLRIVIARGASTRTPVPTRRVPLELVGHDRPGIVRDLSQSLASRGISIEELHTEVVDAAMAGGPLFRVKALLAIPETLSNDEVKKGLEELATEMMVDLGIG